MTQSRTMQYSRGTASNDRQPSPPMCSQPGKHTPRYRISRAARRQGARSSMSSSRDQSNRQNKNCEVIRGGTGWKSPGQRSGMQTIPIEHAWDENLSVQPETRQAQRSISAKADAATRTAGVNAPSAEGSTGAQIEAADAAATTQNSPSDCRDPWHRPEVPRGEPGRRTDD